MTTTTQARKTVTIRRHGNSLGVNIPKDALTRADLQEGDELTIAVNAEGLLLTPYDPEFEATMETFMEIRSEDRDVFRALAKL